MPQTANGTVTFLTKPSVAAQQAVKDARTYQAGNADITAPQVSAAAGVISALAGIGNLGVGVANLVKKPGGGAVQDNLELEITNYSSQVIVPFDYVPSHCDFARIAQPTATGESDTYLLVAVSVAAFSTSTNFNLDLMVGAIVVNIAFAYTNTGNPGRWQVTMTVDGGVQVFDPQLQLIGAQFVARVPAQSFSVYTAPIETTSGSMTVYFYDTTA